MSPHGRLAPLVLLLAACRASPALSPEAVVLDLPPIEQRELHDCGLASVEMLCAFWQVEVPAAERAYLARRAAEAEGLSGDELRAALERAGLETFLFEGTLDREPTGLYLHVDEGRPLLVMLDGRGGSPHYSLVHGYDPRGERIVLLDPARGRTAPERAAFERAWSACRRFTLLALPRGGYAGDRSTPGGTEP